MKDFFNEPSCKDITDSLAGEVLKSISHEDDRADDLLVLEFESGKSLRIRYDWIYEYEIVER